MLAMFGNGLEIFVPEVKLWPGSEFTLKPQKVDDRPILVAAPLVVELYLKFRRS